MYYKRIRDLFEYALYKFTLYLLTYLLTYFSYVIQVRSILLLVNLL